MDKRTEGPITKGENRFKKARITRDFILLNITVK